METLGVWLRQTRENRGETLGEVEAATRIRARFLEMLEAGEFDALPGGEVQVRGFLRIYARYLDLSPDQVLARYDREVRRVEPTPEALPEQPPVQQHRPSAPPVRPVVKPTPPQPGRSSPPTSVPRWFSLETLIITCIVLIVLLVILIVVMLILSQARGSEVVYTLVAPTAVPAGAVVLSTRTPTPLAPTPTFPVDPEGYVMVMLVATEHVWARVRVDGRTAFEGMFSPGQSETWSGREDIVVQTGNGAGLQVTVNRQPQGAVGGRAETCTRGWGPNGEVSVP